MYTLNVLRFDMIPKVLAMLCRGVFLRGHSRLSVAILCDGTFLKKCFGLSVIVTISPINNFPTICFHSIDEIIISDFEYNILRKVYF